MFFKNDIKKNLIKNAYLNKNEAPGFNYIKNLSIIL